MIEKKWWVLFAVTIGISVVFIDISVIPVAVPTIREEFQLTGIMGDWVINAYTLALTILLIPGARMVEMLGGRRALLWGMAIFGVASGLGGFSQSGEWLITSRAILGMGGALMLPAAQYILLMTFPMQERGRALASYFSIGSIFFVCGPLIGGVLTEYWTWRGLFWINFPIVIVGMSAILQIIPLYPGKKKISFDVIGFVWVSSAVFCITLGIMQGDRWGWTSWPILFLLSIAAVLFSLAYFILKRIPIPIVDLSLLKTRHFLIGMLCTILGQMLFISPLFWSMYFQTDLFYHPAEAGFLTFIANSALIIGGPLIGIMLKRYGARVPVIMGFLLLLFCISWMLAYTTNRDVYLFLPALIPFG